MIRNRCDTVGVVRLFLLGASAYLLMSWTNFSAADYTMAARPASMAEKEKIANLIRRSDLNWYSYQYVEVRPTSKGDISVSLINITGGESVCRGERQGLMVNRRISRVLRIDGVENYVTKKPVAECPKLLDSYANTGAILLPDAVIEAVFDDLESIVSSTDVPDSMNLRSSAFRLERIEFQPKPGTTRVGLVVSLFDDARNFAIDAYLDFVISELIVLSTSSGEAM